MEGTAAMCENKAKMALERELHNAQAEMSVGCIQGEVCTAGRVKHYLASLWL